MAQLPITLQMAVKITLFCDVMLCSLIEKGTVFAEKLSQSPDSQHFSCLLFHCSDSLCVMVMISVLMVLFNNAHNILEHISEL
jgi:hypothetical protein